jgi:hypothetical protein
MKRTALISLIALFLGVVFHQDFLWQHFFAPPGKVMAPLQSSRTYLGDDYYYYILTKKAPLRLQAALTLASEESRERQPFFYGNSGLENSYRGALVLAGFIDLIAQLIPVDWNLKVAISLILQLGFLMAGLLSAYAVLRNTSRIPWIELALFGFLWAFLSRGAIYSMYAAHPMALLTLPAINYYPDFLRLVNPQIGWAYGLFYIALLTSWFQRPVPGKYAGLVVLALFMGSISISLLLSLLLGLGMYGFVYLIRRRKLHFPLLGIGVALLASFAYTQHQMDLFYLTEKGQNIQTGKFIGLHLKFSYFLLLLFLPLIRSYLPARSRGPLSWIYFASLFIGFIAGCFELGDRLFVRGGGAFVWFLLLFGIVEWCRTVFYSSWSACNSKRHVSIPICLALIVWAGFALNTSIGGWYNYIEKDKADAITWLRTHANRDDVIASADLEDAYLIPLYTHSQPYVQLGDYGIYSEQETLRHYFEMLGLMGVKSRYLANITAYTEQEHIDVINQIRARPAKRIPYDLYQTYTFYGAVIYYPYTISTRNIYASSEANAAFDHKLTAIAAATESKNTKRIDYIIFKKNAGMTIPSGYHPRFSNPSYQILALGTP